MDSQYQQSDSMEVCIARIEEKVDTILERGHDHEKRIRTVEQRQWWGMGAAAALSTGLNWLLKK